MLQLVVRSLVPRNHRLATIDGKAIDAVSIADAYTALMGWTESQRRQYLANTTLLFGIVPRLTLGAESGDDGAVSRDEKVVAIRSHAPDDVTPGVQYNPLAVRGIYLLEKRHHC